MGAWIRLRGSWTLEGWDDSSFRIVVYIAPKSPDEHPGEKGRIKHGMAWRSGVELAGRAALSLEYPMLHFPELGGWCFPCATCALGTVVHKVIEATGSRSIRFELVELCGYTSMRARVLGVFVKQEQPMTATIKVQLMHCFPLQYGSAHFDKA